jgi:ABC-type lipoprotein release transport system permease subunit
LVAVIVSLLSAYVPIRRASRLPVKDVVLGTVEEKVISNKVKLGFGMALFVLSLILPRIGGERNSNLSMAAGGFSLLGLLLATIIVIPLVVDAMSIILERVYAWILGNEGKLAARNLRQNKNIHQNITLLFISLSAVIVISVVISFAVSYVTDVFGGDLDGFSQGEMDARFVEQVKAMPGVKKVLAIHDLDGRISANGETFARMEAVDDLVSLNRMLNVLYDDVATQQAVESSFAAGRNILLSESCLKRLKLAVGDRLILSDGSQEYEYKILARFKSRGDNSDAIIPAGFGESDFGAVNFGMLAYQADNPEAVMVQIRNLFGNRYNWSRTVKEFRNDFLGVVDAFLSPMKKLTYFVLLLAAVGVVNNLLINFIQKRRAIAMYRSVGLSNRQNVKMTLVEGFTSGAIGAVVGLFVAYMEVDTIFIVAGPRISVRPDFDGTVFILAGLAGIAITLIGSVAPILKGSKMRLVEEIKFE